MITSYFLYHVEDCQNIPLLSHHISHYSGRMEGCGVSFVVASALDSRSSLRRGRLRTKAFVW
jgi:hypothetical protein